MSVIAGDTGPALSWFGTRPADHRESKGEEDEPDPFGGGLGLGERVGYGPAGGWGSRSAVSAPPAPSPPPSAARSSFGAKRRRGDDPSDGSDIGARVTIPLPDGWMALRSHAPPAASGPPPPPPGAPPLSLHPSLIAGDAITIEHPTKKGTAVISDGPGRVLYPQAHAVTKFRYNPRQYSQRKRIADEFQLCGLGTPTDHQPQECELVFMEVPKSNNARSTTTHTSESFAFSVLNGIRRGTKIIFAGLCMVPPVIGGYTATEFTVLFSGNGTIWNNGWDTITRGARFAFDEHPWEMDAKSVNGSIVKRPAAYCRTLSESRYNPPVFEYKEMTATAQFLRHNVEINTAISKYCTDIGGVAPTSIMAAYTAGLAPCNAWYRRRGYERTLQPIQLYARWSALAVAMRYLTVAFIGHITDANFDCVASIQTTAAQIIAEEALQYEYKDTARLYGIPSAIESSTDLYRKAMTPPRDLNHAITLLTVIIPGYIDEHRNIAQSQHMTWMAEKVVGTAMTTGRRGQPFDVAIGIRV